MADREEEKKGAVFCVLSYWAQEFESFGVKVSIPILVFFLQINGNFVWMKQVLFVYISPSPTIQDAFVDCFKY